MNIKIKKINPKRRKEIETLLQKKEGLLRSIAYKWFLKTGVELEELYNHARYILISGFFKYYKEGTSLDDFAYYHVNQQMGRLIAQYYKNSAPADSLLENKEGLEEIPVEHNYEFLYDAHNSLSKEAAQVISIILHDTSQIIGKEIKSVCKFRKAVKDWLKAKYGQKKTDEIINEIREVLL